MVLSLIVGFVGFLFFFYFFSYKNRKQKVYQDDLSSLFKYVSNTTFFLQTGENVLYAMSETLPSLNKGVREDVQKTIDILEEDAVLDTRHFEKYEFPALDQFHQNLAIKYNEGGNADDLFNSIQDNIMFELKKRDELHKKRRGFAFSVYTLIGLVIAIPVILRFIVGDLWDTFLSYSIASMSILLITQAAIMVHLYFLQRRTLDISIRI